MGCKNDDNDSRTRASRGVRIRCWCNRFAKKIVIKSRRSIIGPRGCKVPRAAFVFAEGGIDAARVGYTRWSFLPLPAWRLQPPLYRRKREGERERECERASEKEREIGILLFSVRLSARSREPIGWYRGLDHAAASRRRKLSPRYVAVSGERQGKRGWDSPRKPITPDTSHAHTRYTITPSVLSAVAPSSSHCRLVLCKRRRVDNGQMIFLFYA